MALKQFSVCCFHFQVFLNLYVDDAIIGRHNRRMSMTEDDNPPSPVSMDTMEMFNISQPPSMGSPASRQRQDGGLRFPSASPMTPPSNPHTPASPSNVRMAGVSSTIDINYNILQFLSNIQLICFNY